WGAASGVSARGAWRSSSTKVQTRPRDVRSSRRSWSECAAALPPVSPRRRSRPTCWRQSDAYGNGSVRATVDASIWVAAFLSRRGASRRVLDALIAGAFEHITSAPLLEELGLVLADDQLIGKYGLSWRESEQLLEQLRDHSMLVAVTKALHGCRDP